MKIKYKHLFNLYEQALKDYEEQLILNEKLRKKIEELEKVNER